MKMLSKIHLSRDWALVATTLAATTFVACGGSKKEPEVAQTVATGTRADDQARCEFEGRDDRDVEESSAPGSVIANVRRVYGYVDGGGERGEQHEQRPSVCPCEAGRVPGPRRHRALAGAAL